MLLIGAVIIVYISAITFALAFLLSFGKKSDNKTRTEIISKIVARQQDIRYERPALRNRANNINIKRSTGQAFFQTEAPVKTIQRPVNTIDIWDNLKLVE
jgi:Flp pilus assembly protein TadB